MMTGILLGTAIICYLALLFTFKPQAKYNNGMLFAVTLPEHAMDHAEVHNIQVRFKKRLTQFTLWSAVFLIPFILFHTWTGYQTIYFFVWIAVFIIAMIMPFRHAFQETLALKRENDWFVGTKRVIQSDLRIARLKNQRLASLWLFMIPFVMAIGLMVWAAREDIGVFGFSIGGFVLTLMFFFISLSMRRSKVKVYSVNSDVNVSLNQSKRRALSFLWLMLAIIENIHFLLIYCLAVNNTEEIFGVWVTIVLLFSLIPVGVVLYVYRKVNTLEQEILAQDGKIIYTDDDEYWANGFTYHNPDDKSIMVSKRVGVGKTVNTGTSAGKLILWGSLGLTAVLLIGVSFMLIRSEMTSPILTITSEHRVEINYPMYSFDFDLADIEQLSLVDNIPSGMKTNGEATDAYSRGHFRLKELGKSRLYIFKKNPPYIKIKLADAYIFYNDKDPLQTKQLYDQLQEQLQSK
jgi:uncharacterized membrane protein